MKPSRSPRLSVLERDRTRNGQQTQKIDGFGHDSGTFQSGQGDLTSCGLLILSHQGVAKSNDHPRKADYRAALTIAIGR